MENPVWIFPGPLIREDYWAKHLVLAGRLFELNGIPPLLLWKNSPEFSVHQSPAADPAIFPEVEKVTSNIRPRRT